MSAELNLVHLRPDLQRLVPWAQRQGLVPGIGSGDLGYAFHAALRAAFGDLAPPPFSYRALQGLLAYSRHAQSRLQEAAALASPDVAVMLGIDSTSDAPGLLVRAFPGQWKVGHPLAFEVRVRPVVRCTDGRERDAFLAFISRHPEGTCSREAVYLDWLKRQFTPAAQVHNARMTEYKLTEVVRRSSVPGEERRARSCVVGPDASFQGLLEVTDATAFAALLCRGIGRHRAFGFGMLLLKSAASVDG